MNIVETKILELEKNSNTNLKNISKQIEEIKKLSNIFSVNKKFIDEWDENDEYDDFDDGVWIEFPFTKAK